jgi:hypothetical protein
MSPSIENFHDLKGMSSDDLIEITNTKDAWDYLATKKIKRIDDAIEYRNGWINLASIKPVGLNDNSQRATVLVCRSNLLKSADIIK